MYITLGNSSLVRDKEVVGIFDLDATTLSIRTRDFLKKAQDSADVINATGDLPKAFVVCSKKRREQSVYIVRYMPQTIKKQILSEN